MTKKKLKAKIAELEKTCKALFDKGVRRDQLLKDAAVEVGKLQTLAKENRKLKDGIKRQQEKLTYNIKRLHAMQVEYEMLGEVCDNLRRQWLATSSTLAITQGKNMLEMRRLDREIEIESAPQVTLPRLRKASEL